MRWESVSKLNTSGHSVEGRRFAYTAAVAISNKIYVFGGYATSTYKDFYMLDYVRKKWTKLNETIDTPSPRCGHCMVLCGDLLCLIGGWSHIDGFQRDTLHVFDIALSEWVPITAYGDILCARYLHTGEPLPATEEMIVFGGLNRPRYFNDVHKLRVDNFTWTKVRTKGTPPCERALPTSCVENTNFYIFGGQGAGGDNILGDFFVFDTLRNIWSEVNASGAKPRVFQGATLVNIDGSMLLFGGYDGFHWTNFVYRYTSESNRWIVSGGYQLDDTFKIEGDLPPNISYHASVAATSKMIVLGGREKEFSTYYVLHLNGGLNEATI